MRKVLAVSLVTAGLATSPGCAHNHYQLTNRQVAIGAAVIDGVTLLVLLAVNQCSKGGTFCDESPAGPQPGSP